jgi:hypothetical protein
MGQYEQPEREERRLAEAAKIGIEIGGAAGAAKIGRNLANDAYNTVKDTSRAAAATRRRTSNGGPSRHRSATSSEDLREGLLRVRQDHGLV